MSTEKSNSQNKNIDSSAIIHPSSFIHKSVIIGKNVRIGPNCSIGYEGFEFPRDKDGIGHLKDHQGGVILEEGVEIQANCAIARHKEPGQNTVLHKYVKLDNLIHIAHNCEIGEGTLMAAGVILGGSITIGKFNFLGLNCTLKPLIKVGDYNLIGMAANVICDIPDHEIWAGNPAKKLRDNAMFKKK
jgi:UDP-3-O-[3-hydroxymyristoyl] glucosamine N-acyltransferase